jgi:metallophosphoesterase (TIGR00282 family)
VKRFIAIGDIMGKAGRRHLEDCLPRLRKTYEPDAIIVNGENAAGGLGLTKKIYDRFVGTMAIDAITMGNHWHDKREIYNFMNAADRMVLPANMANVSDPNRGLRIIKSHNGTEFAVINVIGKAFMYGENRCPFEAADQLLNKIPQHIKIRIIDVHAEATSEKQGMAHYFAGRVSLIYGTHTHCPTGDERIIQQYSGFTTDLGMTGPYDSVIGIRKEAAILRLRTGEKKKFEPATGDPWLCALVVDIDEETGACKAIQRIRWEREKAGSSPS